MMVCDIMDGKVEEPYFGSGFRCGIEEQFPCICIIINDKYLIRGSALGNGLKNLEAIIKNLRQNSIANTDLVITLEKVILKTTREIFLFPKENNS